MAVFYGQFKVDTFRRQMKENRKIEELILMFATHATSVLRKDPTLTADGKWNVELNSHIVQFVKLLRESLRTISHVSPELTARLDVYAAKLAPSERTTQSESDYDSSSTSQPVFGTSPPVFIDDERKRHVIDQHGCEAISNSCGPSAGAREAQECMHRTGGTDRSENMFEKYRSQ